MIIRQTNMNLVYPSLTTPLVSGNIRYDIAPPLAAMKNNSARQLFHGNMRELTKEETEKYEESLEKIYKPIGVNIFDIC